MPTNTASQYPHNSLELTIQLGRPRRDPAGVEQKLPLIEVEEIPASSANLIFFGLAYANFLRVNRQRRRVARRRQGRAGHGL